MNGLPRILRLVFGLVALLTFRGPAAAQPLFDSGLIPPGGTFVREFGTAGIFAYHCSVHPSEQCFVIVSPSVIDILAGSPCNHSVPGRIVMWRNSTPSSHTVTSDSGELDSGLILPGETFSHEFPAGGTYPYRCLVHATEACAITVAAPASIAMVGPGGAGFSPCDAYSQGRSVVWGNTSAFTHAIFSDPGTEFSSGSVLSGGTFTHAFSSGGVFTYRCAFHLGEACAVTVGSLVVDLTGPDGFSPCHASALQGEFIVWRNTGGATHTITSDQTVGVGPDVSPPVAGFVTDPWPNPARAEVSFRFALPRPGWTRVEVFDVSGSRVRLLDDRLLEAGAHHRTWDLRSPGDGALPPGLYFLRVQAPGVSQFRPVAILR